MNTSRLNHHVRHNWEIVFLLLLILAVFCVAGGLLVQRVSNVSVYKFLPVALDSVLATDYGMDPNPTRRPPLRLDIIWDTLHDHDPDAEDLAERMAALMNRLQTPVPVVTPQLCQGIHVIYASQDTWLDSARPTDINGSETTLRLGFSDTGRKRPLLYFPVSDRIPPGTFAGRARLELELPPDTPAAVPGSVCFFNLSSSFDETGTNWSNQPEADLPYCSQAISAAKNLHTWDVTGPVNDWLQGHYPNSGLMIDLASPAAVEPVYFSREAAGLANFQTSDPARQVGPRLVIDCGGPLPAPEAGEIAQVPPTAAPGLPAATGTPQPPALAATSTALAGSPPPVSATPPATPVIPPTGTRAATVTAPVATPTRPVATGSPTPATTPTRPAATGSPTPATTPTRPAATGSPTPPTVAPTLVAPSPTVPPATSTSPPEPTSKPPTSTPTATPVPTSTPSPTATAVPQADLVISKSDSPDPVTAGNTLTYTLAITNNGPSTATGVVFTDTLPAGVAFASAPAGCGHNAGLVTCDAGSLASGGSRTYQVTVAVDPAASGTLINSATVTGSETDPVSNNTSTIGTTVTAEADLAVSKSVDNAAPLEQDQVLYTVTVANGGPSHATGVVISDPLPVGLAYVSDNSGGSYNSGSGLWTVGNLDGSASVTLLITATVNTETAGKTITNTALISTSDQPDPDPGNDTASVIITPALPALSIGDVTVTEGDSGTTAAIFTVTLSAAVTQTVTVNYGTADNTATLADNDYNAVGGTLTFSPGVTTQTVTVQVNGDTTLESNESFFVNLSNPAGAGIAAGQGKGTILDDDSLSTITLTDVWDAWMEKNNPGNTHGNEDNMQVKPPNQEYRILINFHTLTTALPAGSTVLAATLHLYQDGVRTGQAISIYPLTTNWVEGEVKWSKAANGPGGDWVNPAGGGDFDTGTTWATFDPATGGHRYINITGLVQAWATGAYDNYGMILTSTSSGPDDGAVKFYTHEHATSAWRPSLEITYTSGSVSQLSLSIGNVTVSEGDSGTTPAVFNVTLSGASTQTVTVDYATADNTATTADNDYVAANGTLTFAPGVTQQPITVTVIGDTKPENSQSFFVNLSNPQNAVIANGQGLGTIVQDVGGLSLPEGGGDRRLYLPVIVKPGN